ncbi:MAG: choice-of-anchor J domain-containing protein [Bacteroidota bacterium]
MNRKQTLNRIALFAFFFTINFAFGQTTETFETEAADATSFIDNGQVFNITSQAQGPFDMYVLAGAGWNGTAVDNVFIDNTGYCIANQGSQFTISTAGSVPFRLKSMYLFLSKSDLTWPVSGTLTITGKLGGVTQYTASSSSGFVASWSTNNGFTLIDMSTFGGSNNANVNIDQFVISTNSTPGNISYIALDAMKWATAPNPTILSSGTLSSFTSCNGFASTAGSFTVSGTNLTSNLAVDAPVGYEVSLSAGSSYSSSLSLTPSSGSVGNTNVYVRLSSTASGSPSGNVTCSSAGATMQNIAVTGTVKTVSLTAASQTDIACYGGATGAASVSASGGTLPYIYNWTPGDPTGDGTVSVTGLTVGTWTCSASDANSCTATKTFSITQPSAAVVPILSDYTSSCVVNSLINPVGTDNCGAVMTGTTTQVFPITAEGTTVVTWKFNDGSGNTITASQNVIIDDITPPITPVLADVTSECEITSLTAPVTKDYCTSGALTEFSEGFDNIASSGWVMKNLSTPVGILPNWAQGDASSQFGPEEGTGFAYANYNVVQGANTISAWLISPEITFNNGDVISFYTRTVATPAYPDRLQVRLSTNGTSSDVGSTNESIGDFTTLIDEINPSLSTSGYPNVWTLYTYTISGMTEPKVGRLAFRYYVPNGGPSGTNSDFIGIDNFVYTPVPGTVITGTNTETFPITTSKLVTWTFNDGRGNITTANQNVIIDDVTAPIPNVSSLNDVTADCSLASLTAPTATDACAGTITGTTTTTFPITTKGLTTLTWTFNDGKGNTSTQTQNVTINSDIVVNTGVRVLIGDNNHGQIVSSDIDGSALDTFDLGGLYQSFYDADVDPINKKIYMSWYYGIYSMNYDGTALDTLVIGADGYSDGVAVDAANGHVYWASGPDKKIYRSNLDGTNQIVIYSTTGYLSDVDIDLKNGHLYFGDWIGSTKGLYRINLDGTNLIPITTAYGIRNLGLDVKNNVIYYCDDDNGKCRKINFDGSNDILLFDFFAGGFYVDTTNAVLYTTDGAHNNVVVSNLDGSNPQSLFAANVLEAPYGPVFFTMDNPIANITSECIVTSIPAPTAKSCYGTITGTTTQIFPISSQDTTVITWTFDDGHGSSTMATQSVIINDTTKPSIICLSDQTICGNVLPDYTASANVSDNCDLSPVVTQLPIAGTSISSITNVTLKATDSKGNFTECSFSVLPNNNNTGDTTATACSIFKWHNVDYNATGDFTQTFTNDAGCDSVVTLHLTINNSNATTDIISACDSFIWIDGVNYTSSNTTATHSLTNTTGCDSVITLNLTIHNSFTVDLGSDETLCSNNGDVLVLDAGNPGMTYLWNNNSTNQNLTVNSSAMTSGKYNYSVIVTDGVCTGVDTISITIDVCAGVSTSNATISTNICPNPSSDGIFNVEIKGNTGNKSFISVYDATGRKVFENIYSTANCKIDLKGFASGMYTLVINTEKQSVSKRIVISDGY